MILSPCNCSEKMSPHGKGNIESEGTEKAYGPEPGGGGEDGGMGGGYCPGVVSAAGGEGHGRGPGAVGGQEKAHSVRSADGRVGHHLDRSAFSPGKGPCRTVMGHVPGPAGERVASGQSLHLRPCQPRVMGFSAPGQRTLPGTGGTGGFSLC